MSALLLLLLLHLLSHSLPPLSAFPLRYPEVSMLIDCGGSTNSTSNLGGNRTWLSDRYFTCGVPSLVSEPHVFSQPQERTLRSFPPTSCGRSSCYSLPLPHSPSPSPSRSFKSRYYLRLFSTYDNYDSKLRSPSFSVSLLGTLAFSFPSPWSPQHSRLGVYYDLFFHTRSTRLDLCFHPLSFDPPVIGSIELASVDPHSYGSPTTGDRLLLINYGRLTCGSHLFGPGFTNDSDAFHRLWQSDAPFRSLPSPRALSTSRHVLGADRPPNHFPERLYRTAITSTDHAATISYSLPVDPGLDYLMWFHFAELDKAVVREGQRVFDVYIDGENVQRIDVFEKVGGFAAFTWQHVVRNLNASKLNVTLAPVVGPPMISGIENYAMVPLDPVTVPSQAEAMRALKESLRVPERMGWNGDPCAPVSVDAWEGITCQHTKDRSGLVITQLDLGSQGLKGYITDQISLLSDLISLNLSSNSLEGTLPLGLGRGPLKKLDLSGNQFSGSIPDSLGSSKLQVVLLNDNQLEGQVPEKLYSIGVHGGEIDLSGNKGLCGVPSLPPCSLFWEKGKLNKKGKMAVGLSCAVLLCLISLAVYIFRLRRKQHHYEFAFSQDLTSVAAKRNRYQRQKSLMLMEMETQNSNGFHSNPHPL